MPMETQRITMLGTCRGEPGQKIDMTWCDMARILKKLGANARLVTRSSLLICDLVFGAKRVEGNALHVPEQDLESTTTSISSLSLKK